jgi:uncharacterized protein (TIGR04255 family)
MTLPLRGTTADAPFTGRKLLQRGLVLVQFSPVLRIADQSGAGIADFQDDIRDVYPNYQVELETLLQVEFKADGAAPQPLVQHVPVFRFLDSARAWKVSLTSESIGLEVPGDDYTNSEDFARRMERIVRAVGKHFRPAETQRIGVRFVNAAPIDGDADPRAVCARELVSVTGESDLVHSDLLWRFVVDEGELILRSGVLAPDATHDPRMLDPAPVRRWYLDIDVINVGTANFDADNVSRSIMAHVRRVHAVYRWAMPSEGEIR